MGVYLDWKDAIEGKNYAVEGIIDLGI